MALNVKFDSQLTLTVSNVLDRYKVPVPNVNITLFLSVIDTANGLVVISNVQMPWNSGDGAFEYTLPAAIFVPNHTLRAVIGINDATGINGTRLDTEFVDLKVGA